MAKKSAPAGGGDFPLCAIRRLPEHLEVAAAAHAVRVNPVNAPPEHTVRALVAPAVATPQHLALLTSRYWGAGGVHLSVQFMDGGSQALRSKILQVVNRWGEFCNARFEETGGQGDIRILRGQGGYWSYLGTDIQHIPPGQQTMNLEGFSEQTPDSEFLRVPPHEFGHTLGFFHEHSRPEIIARLDARAVIADFQRTQGWSRQEIVEQILTPPQEPFRSGAPDDRSIMCYSFPARLTRDGRAIPGGTDFTQLDRDLAGTVYPLAGRPPVQPPAPPPASGKKRITLEVDLGTGAASIVTP